jgi:hypothetical protein
MPILGKINKGLATDPPKTQNSTPRTDSTSVTLPGYKWNADSGQVMKKMNNDTYVAQTPTQVYNYLLERDDIYLPNNITPGKTRSSTRNMTRKGMFEALDAGDLETFRTYLNPSSAGAKDAIFGVDPIETPKTGVSLFRNKATSKPGRLIF